SGRYTVELDNFRENDVGNYTVFAEFEGDSQYKKSSSNSRQLEVTLSTKPKLVSSILSLNSLPTNIERDDIVVLSGRLVSESGNSISFKRINLVSDNTNEIVLESTTNSNGEFKFHWKVGHTYNTYRWYVEFEGDSQYSSTTSEIRNVIITLQPDLYLTPLPNRVNEDTMITFSGQLTSEGLPLSGKTIYIKDDINLSKDETFDSITTDQNGKFSAPWKSIQRDRGSYDFYAIFEGDVEITKVKSATYSVYVTPEIELQDISINTDKSIFEDGEELFVYGTATPGEEIEIKLVGSNKNTITQEIIKVDSSGSFNINLFTWSESTNVQFGDYSISAESPIDKRHNVVWVSFIQSEPDTFETKITLNRPSDSVIIGKPVSFTGQLLTANGDSITSQPIGIGTEIDGNSIILDQGYTDSSGRFNVNWDAKYVSSSAITVFAFYTGNQIFETAISDGYKITIEKPTLSVFTGTTEFEPGDAVTVYGTGTPGDRISINVKSNSGQVVSSKVVSVNNDGSYSIILFLSNTLSDGKYVVTSLSSNFSISDSTQINVTTIIPETTSISGNVHYGGFFSHNDLSGLKTILKVGENYQTDYTNSKGNFEFNNIKFDPNVEYKLWFEMTDGKSFSFIDGNKYNPDKYENPSAEGKIITSYSKVLQIDKTKSINNFSINLDKFLPYDKTNSHIITKGFDTQTKIVEFYSKNLGERPPIINIFLFKDDGFWYWSTDWDSETGKVSSKYQPRINIYKTTGFDAFGMEYTHYVQDYTYYKMTGYDTSPKGENGCNHCGFNNESTADSWVEGVGSFLPAAIKHRENLSGSGEYHHIDLESNIYAPNSDEIQYYRDGKLIWLDEEYSIATLLWDMYDNENDGENISLSIGQVWNLIKGFDYHQRHYPTHDSEDKRHIKYFKDFYDYLVENSSIPKNDIDELFILHNIPKGWAAGQIGRP
ncbi:MAG: hypothetical protein ISR80_05430, partial [Nitrosopumilus sp.]|nr:hypothetical protein [Nitrosopumilus sp.]